MFPTKHCCHLPIFPICICREKKSEYEAARSFAMNICSVESLFACSVQSKAVGTVRRASLECGHMRKCPWGNAGCDLAMGSVLPALSRALLPGRKWRMPRVFAVARLKRSPSRASQGLLHTPPLEESNVC